MQKKDICAYIKKHAGIKTAQECADATGCHRGTIFRYAKELGVSFTKPKDSTMKPSEAVQEDKKKLSAEYQKRFVEDKYKLLLKENLYVHSNEIGDEVGNLKISNLKSK